MVVPPPESDRWIHATVLAGGIETGYRRAGRGACVLLLAGPRSDQLLRELSDTFRVIAPDIPPSLGADSEGLAAWLRDLLEGLGLATAAMLVEPRFEPAARLASSGAERAGPVAILEGGITRPQLAELRAVLAGRAP